MTVNTQQASVTVSASNVSASSVYPAMVGKQYIRVINAATALAYITTGAGSATATATNTPVAAGMSLVVQKPLDNDYVAVILATGTGSVAFQVSSNPQE